MLDIIKFCQQREGDLNVWPHGPEPLRCYKFRDLRLFVLDMKRVIERYEHVIFSVGTFTFIIRENTKIPSEVQLWRAIADRFDCIEDFDKPFVLWEAFDVRREALGIIGG